MIKTVTKTISTVNQWCIANGLPLFFNLETRSFSNEFRVDLEGFGWVFSLNKWTGSTPGYVAFWIDHLKSGQSARFGAHPSFKKPLEEHFFS